MSSISSLRISVRYWKPWATVDTAGASGGHPDCSGVSFRSSSLVR